MAMREEVLTIPVAGANGAAIGEDRTLAFATGRFAAAIVEYTSQPSTCVVTITEIESGHEILEIPGNIEDSFSSGFPLYGRIKVAVTVGNAGSVKVRLRWETN